MDIPLENGVNHVPVRPPDYPEFYGIILPLFAVCGTVCNILCIAVFQVRHMRSSSTTYLTALALADTMVLVTFCLLYSPRAWIWITQGEDPDFYHPYPEIYVRSSPLVSVSMVLVVIYTMEATVDQYAFIYKDTKETEWTHPASAQNNVIISLGVVLLMHLMNFFKLQVVEVDLGAPDPKLVKVCISPAYMTPTTQIWDKYIYYIVFGWIPLIVVIILDAIIIFKVQYFKMNKMPTFLPERFFKDGRSNKAVIGIGILALVCMLPHFVMRSLMMYTNDVSTFNDLPICYHHALNSGLTLIFEPWMEFLMTLLAVINSSGKLFLYMGLNKQFRYTFLYYLKKPCSKKVTNHQPSNFYILGNSNSSSSSVIELDSRDTEPNMTYSGQNLNNQKHKEQNRPYVANVNHVQSSDQRYPWPGVPEEHPKHTSRNTPKLVYYEDQVGSRRLLPKIPSMQAYDSPSVKHQDRNSRYPPRGIKSESPAGRKYDFSNSSPRSYRQENKAHEQSSFPATEFEAGAHDKNSTFC